MRHADASGSSCLDRTMPLHEGGPSEVTQIPQRKSSGRSGYDRTIGPEGLGRRELSPSLGVHGLLGLCVPSASVMPRIIAGPTNAPTAYDCGRASKLLVGWDA